MIYNRIIDFIICSNYAFLLVVSRLYILPSSPHIRGVGLGEKHSYVQH